MAEWLKAAVLKTVEGNTSGGSNPSLPAILKLPYEYPLSGFYHWIGDGFMGVDSRCLACSGFLTKNIEVLYNTDLCFPKQKFEVLDYMLV